MSPIIETLYSAWIGSPDPSKWPEALRDSPVDGHGQYCFREGLILGLLLYTECMAGDLHWL